MNKVITFTSLLSFYFLGIPIVLSEVKTVFKEARNMFRKPMLLSSVTRAHAYAI
jgi:hypothetical protein